MTVTLRPHGKVVICVLRMRSVFCRYIYLYVYVHAHMCVHIHTYAYIQTCDNIRAGFQGDGSPYEDNTAVYIHTHTYTYTNRRHDSGGLPGQRLAI
jgi:hypothetical protein